MIRQNVAFLAYIPLAKEKKEKEKSLVRRKEEQRVKAFLAPVENDRNVEPPFRSIRDRKRRVLRVAERPNQPKARPTRSISLGTEHHACNCPFLLDYRPRSIFRSRGGFLMG